MTGWKDNRRFQVNSNSKAIKTFYEITKSIYISRLTGRVEHKTSPFINISQSWGRQLTWHFYTGCTLCLFEILLHVSYEKNLIPKLNKINFPTKYKHENKSSVKSKFCVTGTHFPMNPSIFAFHCHSTNDIHLSTSDAIASEVERLYTIYNIYIIIYNLSKARSLHKKTTHTTSKILLGSKRSSLR